MSTDRKDITSNNNPTINSVSFSGGQERGRCLQLTQATMVAGEFKGYGYIQVDKNQARKLAKDLIDWLQGYESSPVDH